MSFEQLKPALTADELLRALCLGESREEDARDVVEAYLEERGELPAEVLHTLMTVVVGERDIEKLALAARAAWFRRRGARVPRMPRTAIE